MSKSYSSSARNCHISSKKAVLVANVIRGMKLTDAALLLQNMNNKSSVFFGKLVKSLSSDIENNHREDYSDFVISEVQVSKGQVLKRIQQRAKGRADRRLKRYAHLYITALNKN